MKGQAPVGGRPRAARAFRIYAIVMVTAVAIVPTARAVWLWLAGTEGIALLATPAAIEVAGLVAAGIWIGALLAGRVRGPALLRPFPTHVRAASDVSRVRAFGPAAARSGVIVVIATTLVAASVATALLARGLTSPVAAAAFIVAGALVGVIAAVAWLAGQAAPRLSAVLAAVIVAALVITTLFGVGAWTPWGLVGALYPSAAAVVPFHGALPGPVPEALRIALSLTAFVALAASLGGAVPALMRRLEASALVAQAIDADAAASHAAMFDMNGALARYRSTPTAFRRVRAVAPTRSLAATFLRRDAIGAARAPVRVLAGCAGLVIAGILAFFAVAGGAFALPLGAIAGVVAFVAFGPLTEGIRHATEAAESAVLYGVADSTLLALHSMLPLLIGVLVLVIVGALCVAAYGGTGAAAPLSGLVLAVLALGARIADARKGPMPVRLLVPIPTEAGDLGALRRAMWAGDALLLAMLAGAAASLVFELPIVMLVAAVIIAGVATARRPKRA